MRSGASALVNNLKLTQIACTSSRSGNGRLFYLFNHFNKSPAFGLAQRTGFHDLHHITDTALILVIMSMELGSLLNELTVDRVFHFTFNRNGDGFGHLVAGHYTNSYLS